MRTALPQHRVKIGRIDLGEAAQMRPDPTRRKIALFGNFGTGNLGNEATLQAMVYNLRRHLPNVEISCICSEPENTASEYKICAVPIRATFPIWRWSTDSGKDDERARGPNGSVSGTATETRRWFKAFPRLRVPFRICASVIPEAYRWFKGIARLKESNLLIMTGTGMLDDYAITPFALHYDIFRWAVIAKLCRCKLLFVSVGGGPIRHPLSKYFVRVALALADYRSYRDVSSRDHLEAIGVDVKEDTVYPDLAFSLPRAVVPANHDPGRPGAVIGVGVMNYHNRFGRSGNDDTIYRDYVRSLSYFVIRLLELGYTVRILIGDVVYDQGVRQDLRTVLEERGFKYGNGRIIDEPVSTVDELLSQLSSVDVLVASRFHNLLLALMLGKPVFAISYHEKFRPLMNGVGLGGFCQDIEQIEVDELIGKILSLQANAAGIKLQIARETESYRLALDDQYERILKVSPPVKRLLSSRTRHG
jgi:polysaccharide pyruvyl transferase WcaK-like protein